MENVKMEKNLGTKILAISIYLFLLPIVIAQTAQVSIEHVTYGDNPTDIYLTIRNTGTVDLAELKLYVDGELRTTINVFLTPGRAIKKYLYLTPGEYLIEVKTPEGASDALNLTVAMTGEQAEEQGRLEGTVPSETTTTIPTPTTTPHTVTTQPRTTTTLSGVATTGGMGLDKVVVGLVIFVILVGILILWKRRKSYYEE